MTALRLSSSSGPIDLLWCTLGQERHKLAVDLLRARPGQAVRGSLELDKFNVLDHLGLPPRCCVGWQDAVVVAVDDHCGDVVAGNVFAEVFDPGVDASHGADGRST